MAKKDTKKADFFSSMLEGAQKETGVGGIYVAAEHAARLWGFPLNCIPIEWLLGGTFVFPYGNIMEVAGPPGSFKSSFAAELARIVCACGGLVVLNDTENKTSSDMFTAIVGLHYAATQVHHRPCATNEDWQDSTTQTIQRAKELDPKSAHPVLVLNDAITSVLTEKSQEAFEKEGHGKTAGYPVTAKQLTDFMRGLTGMLSAPGRPNWPVGIILVNHLKEETGDTGSYVKQGYTPGGVQKDYMASMRVWASIKGSESYKTPQNAAASMPLRLREAGVEFYGVSERRTIRLKMKKSSVGTDRRSLCVDFYWAWDKEGHQHSWFDWDTCLMSELVSEAAGQELIFTDGSTSGVLEADVTGDHRFQFKVDGTKVFPAAVAPREAAEWLYAQPPMMEAVRSYFHIDRKRKAHTGNKNVEETFGG